jgi:hypothetical protein
MNSTMQSVAYEGSGLVTRGELLYYAGITGIILAVLISIILILVFRHRRKMLYKKIQDEY